MVALIYNYRTLGHTQAHINPLDERPERNPRLNLEQFGLTEADLDREAWNAFFRHGEKMKLRDMIAALEATYSGKIGFEFMHIHNTPVRHWVRERIEAHAAARGGHAGAEDSARCAGCWRRRLSRISSASSSSARSAFPTKAARAR